MAHGEIAKGVRGIGGNFRLRRIHGAGYCESHNEVGGMTDNQTPDERIDAAIAALDRVLCAGMLEAMRAILSDEYIAGVHSEMDASSAEKGRRK